jgi:hypothetical protein
MIFPVEGAVLDGFGDGEGGFLPPSLAFGGPWGPPFFFVINVRYWPTADMSVNDPKQTFS